MSDTLHRLVNELPEEAVRGVRAAVEANGWDEDEAIAAALKAVRTVAFSGSGDLPAEPEMARLGWAFVLLIIDSEWDHGRAAHAAAMKTAGSAVRS